MTRTLFGAPERKVKTYSQKIGIPKPVLQLKDGKVIAKFDSICDAARHNNLLPGCISDVCRGKNKKTGGYGWKYAEYDMPQKTEQSHKQTTTSNYKVIITRVCKTKDEAEEIVQRIQGNIEGKLTYKINKQ